MKCDYVELNALAQDEVDLLAYLASSLKPDDGKIDERMIGAFFMANSADYCDGDAEKFVQLAEGFFEKMILEKLVVKDEAKGVIQYSFWPDKVRSICDFIGKAVSTEASCRKKVSRMQCPYGGWPKSL